MSDLARYLKEKQDEWMQHQSERDRIREEWITTLHHLLDQIQGWLTEEKDQHLLQITEYSIELVEMTIGKYEAPALALQTATGKVVVQPIARYVLGSEGRVDVIGEYGLKARLIYRDNKWYYHPEIPREPTELLTQKVFADLVQRLLP